MIASMTGFAVRKGQGLGWSWAWEVRSVNGKGLDLRLRLPEGIDGLEPAVRAELARRLTRGNVSLTLRLSREAGGDLPRVNAAALQAMLDAVATVRLAANAQGVLLAPPSATEVLCMRGVLEAGRAEAEDAAPLRAALLADLPPLLDDFTASRTAEGAALLRILTAQVDQVATLSTAARSEAASRRAAMAATLRDNLARVLANAEGADETRVAQELAMLAVKADVTEELDRLEAHVTAARSLLAEAGPVGRKLDFLTQEFNREANTLCSKAQAIALTRIGLDLKTVIDQMREQVQNVE